MGSQWGIDGIRVPMGHLWGMYGVPMSPYGVPMGYLWGPYESLWGFYGIPMGSR